MTVEHLNEAIRRGDVEQVILLLGDQPETVNQPGKDGETPLRFALCPSGDVPAQSSVAVIRALLERGADATYTTEKGYDALINAAYGCLQLPDPALAEILNLLIAHGVPLRGETSWKETATRVLSNSGRFSAVDLLLRAGADPDHVRYTPLIRAVLYGPASNLPQATTGANLEERDYWERTPFLFAVQMGDLEKAKLLQDAGADTNACGRCGKPALFYATEQGHEAILRWLLDIGHQVDESDKFDTTALRIAVENNNTSIMRILIAAGANIDHAAPSGTIFSFARARESALFLLDAGADPLELPHEAKRAILSLSPEPDIDKLDASRQEFDRAQTRAFGNANPQIMNEPFWLAMIAAGTNAYHARQKYIGKLESYTGYHPTWCAERFGQSLTPLPDGRIVLIGGEHEDFYDVDFCIYNDVFVFESDGKVTIYGYPPEIFPPTDNHTATLIGDHIYMIGSLGYHDSRQAGHTPVYRLDTRDFRIEKVSTTGDSPGWIFRHRATLEAGDEIRISGGTIQVSTEGSQVENTDIFLLNTTKGHWKRR